MVAHHRVLRARPNRAKRDDSVCSPRLEATQVGLMNQKERPSGRPWTTDRSSRIPPYPLEFILRDATGPDGGYHGNFGHPTSVIVDYPVITGRLTPDSVLIGQKMIEALDGDPRLRRWGC
jgi:hypothetical protein